MKKFLVIALLVAAFVTAGQSAQIRGIPARLIGQLFDVDDTDKTTNDVIKYDGSNWVAAGVDEDLSFSISSFTDNESSPQLIGSGVWRAFPGDVITFDATYNNGPPSAATIAITSDDGSYVPWGTDPLVMDSPFATKDTTESTNYPTVKDKFVLFTLNSTPTDSDTESVTFNNYIWWGDSTTGSSFSEANIEALPGNTISDDQTRSVSINAGGSEYLVFAFPSSYTSLPVGTDYETDGDNGTGFVFNGITCANIEDTTTLSITNSAGFTENYKVYASTLTNLGNHTLTTSTSATAINTIYWGWHTDTSADEDTIEGLTGGSSANSNDNTRTFTVTAGASEYIWYCYPLRLGTVTFFVGGFEGGFESPETVSVTNVNGWSEDYYAYRSTNANLGETEVTTQ